MKKLIKLTSLLGIVSGIAITTVRGQTSVTVDEFGNSSSDTTRITFRPSLADPYNGGIPHMAYELRDIPWNVPGSTVFDILLLDPATGAPSDLLRFQRNTAVGNADTLLFFYSVPLSSPAAPADVSVLPNPVNLQVTANEIGLFGNPYSPPGPDGYTSGPYKNGFVYLAAWGTPGNDGGFDGTQYTFISDVPEPGSLLLISGGLGLLCGLKLFRRKAA